MNLIYLFRKLLVWRWIKKQSNSYKKSKLISYSLARRIMFGDKDAIEEFEREKYG